MYIMYMYIVNIVNCIFVRGGAYFLKIFCYTAVISQTQFLPTKTIWQPTREALFLNAIKRFLTLDDYATCSQS